MAFATGEIAIFLTYWLARAGHHVREHRGGQVRPASVHPVRDVPHERRVRGRHPEAAEEAHHHGPPKAAEHPGIDEIGAWWDAMDLCSLLLHTL